MKVAITGANGLFGHALVQVIGASHHVLPMTRADADLTRLTDLRRVLLAARPDALIHTAGAPDPDKCERNPEYAFQTNVVAPKCRGRCQRTCYSGHAHLDRCGFRWFGEFTADRIRPSESDLGLWQD